MKAVTWVASGGWNSMPLIFTGLVLIPDQMRVWIAGSSDAFRLALQVHKTLFGRWRR